MLATVQSVVERMNNLMARLSGEPDTAKIESVAIRPLIEAIIGETCLANAAIMLDCPPDLSDLPVRADTRRVDALLRHISEDRAVGKGCGRKCNTRWGPYHKKKQKK